MNSVKSFYRGISAAALALVIMAAAAAFCVVYAGNAGEADADTGVLSLENVKKQKEITSYDLKVGDTFSIGFIHSVNKSPVTDYYELRKDGIYVVRTVYYGFGAGVQTELEDGQTLTYGEDGSMIITGFDRKMEDLIYFVGTVSDHTLVINEGEADEQTVSLRDLCGRNAMVRFSWICDPPAG
ncbi:MAG: DUF1850 domain-containing protein [Lachnospiraceae bacterium]|nr:DUF1850 domain-containing protein [Lachnospiraceae bacterium]